MSHANSLDPRSVDYIECAGRLPKAPHNTMLDDAPDRLAASKLRREDRARARLAEEAGLSASEVEALREARLRPRPPRVPSGIDWKAIEAEVSVLNSKSNLRAHERAVERDGYDSRNDHRSGRPLRRP